MPEPAQSYEFDGYAAGFVPPDVQTHMRAYDNLPRVVQEAIDDAPLEISVTHVFHHLIAHGIASTLREIRESADDYYAAREHLTGVPRPTKPLGKGAGVKLWKR